MGGLECDNPGVALIQPLLRAVELAAQKISCVLRAICTGDDAFAHELGKNLVTQLLRKLRVVHADIDVEAANAVICLCPHRCDLYLLLEGSNHLVCYRGLLLTLRREEIEAHNERFEI